MCDGGVVRCWRGKVNYFTINVQIALVDQGPMTSRIVKCHCCASYDMLYKQSPKCLQVSIRILRLPTFVSRALRDTQAGDLALLALLLPTERIRCFPSHLHAVATPSLDIVHSNVLCDPVLLVWCECDARLRLKLQLRTLACVS